MSKLIIAIDGPAGSGKSTVARRVAELLGYIHLDSGAMYRAVAWKALGGPGGESQTPGMQALRGILAAPKRRFTREIDGQRLRLGVFAAGRIINDAYWPTVVLLLLVGLASLYHLSPPRRLPWRRGIPGAILALVIFLLGSAGLRMYIAFIVAHNHAYGTLAAPIATLLFYKKRLYASAREWHRLHLRKR